MSKTGKFKIMEKGVNLFLKVRRELRATRNEARAEKREERAQENHEHKQKTVYGRKIN